MGRCDDMIILGVGDCGQRTAGKDTRLIFLFEKRIFAEMRSGKEEGELSYSFFYLRRKWEKGESKLWS